ncbi:MAG: DsbA family protein [Sphingomonadales bacterium]
MKLMEQRVRAIWAVAAVLAAGVAGTALGQARGPAQDKAAIEAIVRDYILSHPEIIPEAIDRLRNKETAAAIDANRSAIETPFPGAEAGNPKGDVTLAVFFDYACPYCRQGHADVQKLIAADKNLRVVYREFPVLSPASEEAAMAGISAAKQGSYTKFHNAMFESPGKVSHDRTLGIAKGVGLDVARTTTDMANSAGKAEVDGNLALGRSLGLTGTPSYIVGDRIFSGAVGFDRLKEAVAAARARRTSAG